MARSINPGAIQTNRQPCRWNVRVWLAGYRHGPTAWMRGRIMEMESYDDERWTNRNGSAPSSVGTGAGDRTGTTAQADAGRDRASGSPAIFAVGILHAAVRDAHWAHQNSTCMMISLATVNRLLIHSRS